MKISFLVLAILALAAAPGRADEPKTIGASQTPAYVGRQVTVTGVVAQVSFRPGITFLNFDKPYPDSPFTAVIRGEATNQFENLPALKGKWVELRGKVTTHNEKPQILLEKREQLKVTPVAESAADKPTAPGKS